jgi:hypothetical protein
MTVNHLVENSKAPTLFAERARSPKARRKFGARDRAVRRAEDKPLKNARGGALTRDMLAATGLASSHPPRTAAASVCECQPISGSWGYIARNRFLNATALRKAHTSTAEHQHRASQRPYGFSSIGHPATTAGGKGEIFCS